MINQKSFKKGEKDIEKIKWKEDFVFHNVNIGEKIEIILTEKGFPVISSFTFKDINCSQKNNDYKYYPSKNLQKEIQEMINNLEDIKKYLKKNNLPEKGKKPIKDLYYSWDKTTNN